MSVLWCGVVWCGVMCCGCGVGVVREYCACSLPLEASDVIPVVLYFL